jgi:hypothetical protein
LTEIKKDEEKKALEIRMNFEAFKASPYLRKKECLEYSINKKCRCLTEESRLVPPTLQSMFDLKNQRLQYIINKEHEELIKSYTALRMTVEHEEELINDVMLCFWFAISKEFLHEAQ